MSPLGSLARRYGVQAATLVALAVVLNLTVPGFSGVPAFYSTLDGVALVGITAAGLAVTMIAAELDLSVGSMAALAGVIAVRAGDLGLVAAIAIGTAAGVVLGLLQGLLIARLRISSLVVTVGSLIILQGAAVLLAGGRPIGLRDLTETDPLLRQWGVLSPSSLTGIVVLILLGVFLGWTRWGREIYAIGGARPEATAAGVPVTRSLAVAFAISGGCAGLAGALACMQGASADPNGFATLLLGAVSACLIGGISLYGGRGNATNIALGVLILCVLPAGAAAAGAPTYITGLATGALLLLVVGVDFALGRTVAARRLRAVRARRAEALLSSAPTTT
jgi:ribose/xylose/arabinose/galactoside ABC-type transport system permease subunit